MHVFNLEVACKPVVFRVGDTERVYQSVVGFKFTDVNHVSFGNFDNWRCILKNKSNVLILMFANNFSGIIYSFFRGMQNIFLTILRN